MSKDVQVAKAVADHAQATGEDPEKVKGWVAVGVMLVVPWREGQYTLIFNSPNGL